MIKSEPKTPAYTVLQVAPALKEGGVERSTIEMALYTQKKGWRALVASSGGVFLPRLEEAEISHFTLPLHKKNPLTIFCNALQLAKLAKKEQVTFFHVRSRAPAWSVRLASKFTGIPYITTFHGTHGTKGCGKMAYNRVMVSGKAVIANSKFIQQHLADVYGVKQAPIAPRGVDTEVFNPSHITEAEKQALREALGIAPKTPVILCVGRLTRWKGQDILLKALQKLPKDLAWACVLAGGPDKRGIFAQELATLAQEEGLRGKVHLLGSRSDIPTLNAMADIATSCSTKPEAFGRVAVEGMAMGACVIASAHGGSLETVTHEKTGFLVPPSDTNTLAKTLEKVLRDEKQRAKIAQAGQKWAHAHATTEQTCQAEFAVYRTCVEE